MRAIKIYLPILASESRIIHINGYEATCKTKSTYWVIKTPFFTDFAKKYINIRAYKYK